MMRTRLLVLAALALGVGAATAAAQDAAPAVKEGETTQPAYEQPPKQGQKSERRRALAVLRPTKGNDVSGVVTFEETKDGVRVNAQVSGLPSGEHAYHVHVYGDCSAPDATSAGPHFRFGPADTGITGNLGELSGTGDAVQATRTLTNAKLQGERSIVGRSVVIHAKGNDPSQPPDGAAGARIACGVIGLDEATGPQ